VVYDGRAAARRVREIAGRLHTRGKLSREETTQVIRQVTGELADLAAKAAAVLRNGRRALPRALSGQVRGRLRRAPDELAVTMERTAKIIARTRTRLAGQAPESATRLVSLHDPGARPIRKGRTGRPVEFGYKAQVTNNDHGIALDYSVEYGAARRPAAGARRGAGRPPRRPGAPGGHRRPRLRLGPHPPRRQERSRDLVRARGIRPQPGQDQRPGQLTRPRQRGACCRTSTQTQPSDFFRSK
jgi:hypothetical protein